MRWSAPLAALFLALGYVHYGFVAEFGGNPALVVGWLVSFTATAGVAITNTLIRAQRVQGSSLVMSPYVSGRRSR
jgi:hypothetical protein